VDVEPRDLGGKARKRLGDERELVRPHLLHPERAQPVDRRAEPDRLGDLRGTRLELPGQIGPGRLIRGNGADHVTAADERRHLLEQCPAAVKDADPCRAVGLVAGPGVEVGVDRRQVHRHLWDRLGSVDQHHGAHRVGTPDYLGDRVNGPDHVRDVHERDQLRLACEKRVERLEVDVPVVQDRYVGELRIAVLAEDLPGNDVRVVLHLGEHHQVVTRDVHPAPGVRDEVDRGGRVRGEDRLLWRRSQPRGDPLTGALVEVGRLDGQRIDPTVDRRARLRVVAGHRVDDRLRRLRRGARIQVCQRVVIDAPAQDRELGGNLPQRRGRTHAAAPTSSMIQP
jgi:hypothetical protein